MKQIVTRTALVLSGVLLVLIGGALLASPAAFLATSHVFIDADPGLLSELTAPSFLLIITGGLMSLGAVKIRFAKLALILGAIVYTSYGLGRLISMGLHGLPPEPLIKAMLIEFAVAAVLIAVRLIILP